MLETDADTWNTQYNAEGNSTSQWIRNKAQNDRKAADRYCSSAKMGVDTRLLDDGRALFHENAIIGFGKAIFEGTVPGLL